MGNIQAKNIISTVGTTAHKSRSVKGHLVHWTGDVIINVQFDSSSAASMLNLLSVPLCIYVSHTTVYLHIIIEPEFNEIVWEFILYSKNRYIFV